MSLVHGKIRIFFDESEKKKTLILIVLVTTSTLTLYVTKMDITTITAVGDLFLPFQSSIVILMNMLISAAAERLLHILRKVHWSGDTLTTSSYIIMDSVL